MEKSNRQLHALIELRNQASGACDTVSAQIVELQTELTLMYRTKANLEQSRGQFTHDLAQSEAANGLHHIGQLSKTFQNHLKSQLQVKSAECIELKDSLNETQRKYSELQHSVRALQQQISPVEQQLQQLIQDQLIRIQQLEQEIDQFRIQCKRSGSPVHSSR